MIRQRVFPKAALPETVRLQILSSLRQTWPKGGISPVQLREWMSQQENHPVHIVLLNGAMLVSHAAVVWKMLDHLGQSYRVYGLSGVFTQPAWRGQGLGRQIVEAATAYIMASNADVAMLWCAPGLREFYARWGWAAMTASTTLVGPVESPRVYPLLLMMLFVSGRGCQDKPRFEGRCVYFGRESW